MKSPWQNELEALWPLFVVAFTVALGLEPFALTVKRKTLGKTVTLGKIATGVELRLANAPARPASPRRAAGRFAVSVAACVAAVGASLVGARAVGVVLSPGAAAFLAGASVELVWASVLVSTLFRADRRGWHDLLAGTVLVSTRVTAPCRGSVLGRRG